MAMTLRDLKAAQAGDYDAQQLLLQEVYQPVYHFIRKRIGNRPETDELCQAVFLKVFQKLDSFTEAKASVLTWVFAIARHTLIDYYRREKPVLLNEGDRSLLIDESASTAEAAETREQEEAVAGLLATLPDTLADVVTLRAINEMSYEQIGLIMGKSPEAIRQLYSRALGRLRQRRKEIQ